jgi:hypothetical protein
MMSLTLCLISLMILTLHLLFNSSAVTFSGNVERLTEYIVKSLFCIKVFSNEHLQASPLTHYKKLTLNIKGTVLY